MVINLVRLELYDLAELLDCELQHLGRLHSTLHVADRAQVDPAKQLAGIEIVGIALYDLLRLGDGVPDVSRFEIKLRKTCVQLFRAWIVLERKFIFVDGLAGVLRVSVNRDHFFIHVRQRVVVVSLGAITLFRRRDVRRLLTRGSSRSRFSLRRGRRGVWSLILIIRGLVGTLGRWSNRTRCRRGLSCGSLAEAD